MTQTTDMDAVVEVLRSHDRFLVTSHENPGRRRARLAARDAPGARASSARTASWCSPGPRRCPAEYGFLELPARGLLREVPADRSSRVLVAVDCAQETRLTDARLLEAEVVVNIDHHHDNTRFGTVESRRRRGVVDGELLADVFAELGVALTPAIAEALYTGLVTDTGRFQYANTTPKALRLAATCSRPAPTCSACSRASTSRCSSRS